MSDGIKSTCILDNCSGSNVVGTSIWYAGIGSDCIRDIYAGSAFIKSNKVKVLVGSGVTLKSLGIIFISISVNDCYLSLSLRLVFILIDGVSY